MDALLQQHTSLQGVRKIGEGTFGEAYKGGGVVFKIVPMQGETLVNGEPQKRADEIKAEALIALRLSALRPDASQGVVEARLLKHHTLTHAVHCSPCFVQTHCVGVCRGVYSPTLLEEWHAWDAVNTSENEAPDIFDQVTTTSQAQQNLYPHAMTLHHVCHRHSCTSCSWWRMEAPTWNAMSCAALRRPGGCCCRRWSRWRWGRPRLGLSTGTCTGGMCCCGLRSVRSWSCACGANLWVGGCTAHPVDVWTTVKDVVCAHL